MIANITESKTTPDLQGKRILVVEDEFYIADDVCRILTGAGATILGPVSSVEAAERMVDQRDFDCAVLDLNLHGESALTIADRLAETGRAFIIATGYGSPAVPDRLKHAPRIEKPFEPAALIELTAQITARAKVN